MYERAPFPRASVSREKGEKSHPPKKAPSRRSNLAIRALSATQVFVAVPVQAHLSLREPRGVRGRAAAAALGQRALLRRRALRRARLAESAHRGATAGRASSRALARQAATRRLRRRARRVVAAAGTLRPRRRSTDGSGSRKR